MRKEKSVLFIISILVIFTAQLAVAQSERKLKQELYFHEGKNYKGISFDTLSREYFRWEKYMSKIPSSRSEIRFIQYGACKQTDTHFYGEITNGKKMKRVLNGEFDGTISVSEPYSSDTKSSATYIHSFKFKKPKVFYALDGLLDEEIHIMETDSAVLNTLQESLDRENNKAILRETEISSMAYCIQDSIYQTENNQVLFKELTTYKNNQFIGKNTTAYFYDEEEYIQIYTSFSNENEIIEKKKTVKKLNKTGRVMEETVYYLNKKSGFPDVYQKVSSVKYTYFDPYVEKQEYKCYNGKGKVCGGFTIEVKKSFY